MREILIELLDGEQAKHGMTCLENEKRLRHSQKQNSQRSGQQRIRSMSKVQIRIALFMVLSLCLLSGCQEPPQSYGNFAGVDSADLMQDAAGALHSAYPPAKTNLTLLQPVEDVFGFSLVEFLRSAGYAVAEYVPPEKDGAPLVNTDAGLGFAYTLDALRDSSELRVTLHVGDETLSRLYAIQERGEAPRYIPIGFWVRREGGRHA